MARIIAPNKNYNDVSAGVRFANGEAECSDDWTIKWFKEHGYTVEEIVEPSGGESKDDTSSEGDASSNEVKPKHRRKVANE